MLETAWTIHALLFVTVLAFGHAAWPRPAYHPAVAYEAFHFIAFVVRPFFVIFFGFSGAFDLMRISPSETDILLGMALADVCLAVFLSVSFAATAPSHGLPRYWGLPRMAVADTAGFFLAATVLVPFALYSATIVAGGVALSLDYDIMRGASGAAVMMSYDPLTGNTIYANTTGYVVMAHNFLAPVVVLAVVVGRFRWWSYLPFCGYVAFRLFLGWERWGIVLPLASLLLLTMFRRHGKHIPLRWAALTVGALVVFHFLGTNREAVRNWLLGPGDSISATQASASLLQRLDTLDLSSFDFMVYIMMVVPELSRGYSWFTQQLDVLTLPIPRLLWEGKPTGSFIVLVNLQDYGHFAGLTRGLAGDGWMSLGWLGAIINHTLAAWGLSLAYNKFRREGWRSPGVFYGYLLLLPLTAQLFRDGAVSSFLFFGLWIGLPVALWRGAASALRGSGRERRWHSDSASTRRVTT